MRTASAVLSDIGCKRAANEDFFAIDEELGIFIVADGLGGHVAGRTASETAVSEYLSRLQGCRPEESLTALRRAARCANGAILSRVQALPYLRGMGTTLAALRVYAAKDCFARICFAHIGDSRIYLLRDDVLHPLTLDHSYVCDLVFRHRLPARSLLTHPHRHVITRALGVEPCAEPDVTELEALPGDLLTLCSDGITTAIDDAELCHMLSEGRADLAAAAQALVSCANARGGHDNATVILVRLDG